MKISFPSRSQHITVYENPETGLYEEYHFQTLNLTHRNQFGIDYRMVFPANPNWFDLSFASENSPIQLAISKKTALAVQDITNTHLGTPSNLKGNFGRMFYFSAVTITTLGYGDVVPITPLARFFVAFESILGIVLIGLFLNALSREASRRRDN
jgi:hypothetical protein